MVYLTIDDILAIRDQIEADYRNTFEVRTVNGLMSAVDAPRRSLFGEEMFPTLVEKAGVLFFALVQNHPFVDGNKRVATTALGKFLAANGAALRNGDAALIAYAREIARGKLSREDVTAWLAKHIEYET